MNVNISQVSCQLDYRSKGVVTKFKIYFLLFSLFILAIFLISCSQYSSSSDSKITSKKVEECIEPQNPYNDGGGHDAGFNWAMENGEDCNGNSDSFNEGCEEYHRQLNQYNECIAGINR